MKRPISSFEIESDVEIHHSFKKLREDIYMDYNSNNAIKTQGNMDLPNTKIIQANPHDVHSSFNAENNLKANSMNIPFDEQNFNNNKSIKTIELNDHDNKDEWGEKFINEQILNSDNDKLSHMPEMEKDYRINSLNNKHEI